MSRRGARVRNELQERGTGMGVSKYAWAKIALYEKEGWTKLEKECRRKLEKEGLHVVEGGLARIRPSRHYVLRLDHSKQKEHLDGAVSYGFSRCQGPHGGSSGSPGSVLRRFGEGSRMFREGSEKAGES